MFSLQDPLEVLVRRRSEECKDEGVSGINATEAADSWDQIAKIDPSRLFTKRVYISPIPQLINLFK